MESTIKYRVVRGGSWNNYALLRSTFQNYNPLGDRYNSVGFRLVRTKDNSCGRYMDIFKPDDFIVGCGSLTPFGMAERANQLFNEWLKQNSKRVYGYIRPGDIEPLAFYESAKNHTHQALLICIEPIKKCEHVGVENFKNEFHCRFCRARLVPKGWEEA